MTGLTDIVVSVNDYDEPDGHVEVIVEGRVSELLTAPEFTEDQIAAASLYVAGILGRLAAHSAPWVLLERSQHGCRNYAYEGAAGVACDEGGCHVTVGGSVLDPSRPDNGMGAYFNVPKAQVKPWLERISNWLAVIAEAER